MNDDQNIQAVDEIRRYSTEQFDKNILFIASGALGISFAFIKDIIPDLKKAICKEHLIASWYIFAGVIFISLVGHFVSMLGSNWAIKNYHLDDLTFNKKLNWWNIPIRMLNASTILAILCGALNLIYFINQNITNHE